MQKSSSLPAQGTVYCLIPDPPDKAGTVCWCCGPGSLLDFKIYPPVLGPYPASYLKSSLDYHFSLQVYYLINKIKHVLCRAKITMTIFNQFQLRVGGFCDTCLNLACVSINVDFHFLN